MIERKLIIIGVACAFTLGACGEPEPPAAVEPPPEPAAEAPPMMEEPAPPADLEGRLASDARSAEDRERDAGRKPAQVVEFLGVEPGMDVLDIMAAGGWYSEVLAHAVGPDGSVTAQNPPFMLAFRDGYYDTALAERIGDRLPNVTKLDASWSELAEVEQRFDVALSALNFHDAYDGQSPEDAAEMASAVYTVLEPGGVFGIIDHVGDPGADNKSMHRIDKATVIDVVTAAGFELEDESNLLQNPDDDHTQGVFSEGLRGQTDRFLLKFRKPAM